MGNALRAELRKVWTVKSSYAILVAAIIVSILPNVVLVSIGGRISAEHWGLVATSSFFVVGIAMLWGAVSMGSDIAHKMHAQSFLVDSARWYMVFGKTVSLALFMEAAALVGVVVNVALIGAASGGFNFSSDHTGRTGVVGELVLVPLAVLCGISVAMLLRGTIAALAAMVVTAVVIEPIVEGVLYYKGLQDYMQYFFWSAIHRLLATTAGVFTGEFGQPLGIVIVWTVVLTAAGVAVHENRDIR